MPGFVQRDWVVEADDRLVIGSDVVVASIVSRLPSTPLLRVADVSAALDVGVMTVHRWIEAGAFDTFNVGTGLAKRHQRIVRVSFIRFLQSRVNRV